jgi:hypothetical protein
MWWYSHDLLPILLKVRTGYSNFWIILKHAKIVLNRSNKNGESELS